VKEHLGGLAKKRLILSHHKYMLEGDILIDDRRKRGAAVFKGYHIHFGFDTKIREPNAFPTWASVLEEIDRVW
jgi:5'-nucleotidase